MRVLGLDISSTTIGIGLLNYDVLTKETNLLSAEFYSPPKLGSTYERLKRTENDIQNILDRLQPDIVAIEDILFFAKKSTMRTLILLGIFNRQVGFTVSKWLVSDSSQSDYGQEEPILFPVATIRATLRKIFNQKEIEKENIPHLLQQIFPNFPISKISKGKKIGKLTKETYDMADGVSVALTYIEKHCKDASVKTKGKTK